MGLKHITRIVGDDSELAANLARGQIALNYCGQVVNNDYNGDYHIGANLGETGMFSMIVDESLAGADYLKADASGRIVPTSLSLGYIQYTSPADGYLAMYDSASDTLINSGIYYGMGVGYTVEDNLVIEGDVSAANLNIANWDTAYGWGNHATQNYIKYTAPTENAIPYVTAAGILANSALSYDAVNTRWEVDGDLHITGNLTGVTVNPDFSYLTNNKLTKYNSATDELVSTRITDDGTNPIALSDGISITDDLRTLTLTQVQATGWSLMQTGSTNYNLGLHRGTNTGASDTANTFLSIYARGTSNWISEGGYSYLSLGYDKANDRYSIGQTYVSDSYRDLNLWGVLNLSSTGASVDTLNVTGDLNAVGVVSKPPYGTLYRSDTAVNISVPTATYAPLNWEYEGATGNGCTASSIADFISIPGASNPGIYEIKVQVSGDIGLVTTITLSVGTSSANLIPALTAHNDVSANELRSITVCYQLEITANANYYAYISHASGSTQTFSMHNGSFTVRKVAEIAA